MQTDLNVNISRQTVSVQTDMVAVSSFRTTGFDIDDKV